MLLYNLSINIYRCVRLADLVYFSLLVQTHGYYKGLMLGRIRVFFIILIAAVLAYICAIFAIIPFITEKSQRITQGIVLASVFIYPLFAFLINSSSYKSTTMITFWYIQAEFIKFVGLYSVEEMMREMIDKLSGEAEEEKYRATSFIVESFLMAFIFILVGPIITKLFQSWSIQQMAPYNYLLAFLILSLLFLISFVLIIYADYKVQKKQESQSLASNQQTAYTPLK